MLPFLSSLRIAIDVFCGHEGSGRFVRNERTRPFSLACPRDCSTLVNRHSHDDDHSRAARIMRGAEARR